MIDWSVFDPGEVVAWRNCIRVDETRTHHPSFAIAMTVVRDEPDELVLFRRPGHMMMRRFATYANAPGTFRHRPVARLQNGWHAEPAWGRWSVLLVMHPEDRHAVSLFRDAASGAVDFWYIDLIGPVHRRRFGFDFDEHGLDIVVKTDFSGWRWKDEDELEFAVERGLYSRSEADALYAEGRRAVERLVDERTKFEVWLDWAPQADWQVTSLPEGWGDLTGS